MSLADREGWIWVDGELRPWRDANVHFLTHTLHYGVGVFEGVRAYKTPAGTRIFRLEEHTRRLLRSAHILQMEVPWSEEELNAAQKQVLIANELEEAYIRPLLFYDSGEMGIRTDKLNTRGMIAAWEWPDYISPDAKETGIKVRTSSYTRHHINVSMCKAKATGHYINSILALREAVASGCEEALLLDNEGYVSEGSGENIFLVRNGRLYTPELHSCLDGITRESIMTLAEESGYTVQEKKFTRDEVYIADEAFFTGTAVEVVPICEVDGRRIGKGKRGEITGHLQQLFFDEARGNGKLHPEWLSDVNS